MCLYENGYHYLDPPKDLSIHSIYPRFSELDAGSYEQKEFLEEAMQIRLCWDNR